MEQPPPYQANDQQQGFTNPGFTNYEGYASQGNVENTQGYNPPVISTQENFPQQKGIIGPGYTPQQGYAQQQGFTNPSYSEQAGYPPQQTGYPQQQGVVNPGYSHNEFNASPKQSQPCSSKINDTVGELSGFGEKSIRRGFIRKVYSILMCQLLVTGGIIALFMFVKPVKNYVQQNMWIYLASFGVTLACIIAMACCKDVRRKSPGNFICLGIFTICESFMLGTVSTYYDVDAVILAVGITVAITFGLTVFAFQTKIDFIVCGGLLLCLLLILIISGIIMAILPFSRWSMIGYASAGALIFSFYIIYDTQIMIGGSHKYAISPEEYIFAALNLYLDIINLFMYILMIIGSKK